VQGRRLLVIVDDDNIRISIALKNRSLCYATLLKHLQGSTASVSALAVLTHENGDERRRKYFEDRSWQVLGVQRERVTTHRGQEVKANADMDMCFECGRLVQEGGYDAVLIGSGDGDLCVAIARGLRRTSPACRIVTLSEPSSTSARLRSRPDLFDSSLLIGADILSPSDD
jgi:uncharacterized LabA/DUF88 family protein